MALIKKVVVTKLPRWNVAHDKDSFLLVFGELKLVFEPLHLSFSNLFNKIIRVPVVIPVHGIQHK